MVIKLLFVPSLFLLLNSCAISRHENTSNYPDEVDMYSIGVAAKYLVGIRCGDVQLRFDAKKNVVIIRDSIIDIFALLNDTANYSIDRTIKISNVDTRIEFDYLKNGSIFNTICFSPPPQSNYIDTQGKMGVDRGNEGLLIKSGNVYRFKTGGRLDSLLLAYKLIRP